MPFIYHIRKINSNRSLLMDSNGRKYQAKIQKGLKLPDRVASVKVEHKNGSLTVTGVM